MSQSHTVGRTATRVETVDGTTHVRYHATDVVQFNSEIITLDTGGWATATTKARMNQASNQFDLGFQVYQRSFRWFVSYRGLECEFCRTVELKRTGRPVIVSDAIGN